MQTSLNEIYDAALQLSEMDRAALAARILETLPAGNALSIDDPEFAEELERRFIDREGSLPWTQLRDEV